MLFAVVDIETTGGYAAQGRITEIGIVIHDGERVIDTFNSLVNPFQPIPFFIQKLTGITDDMVRHAPGFGEIAMKVYDLLHDKIFVAHNVSFDFSFVNHQLKEHNLLLNVKKLCTVRTSKQIFKNLTSYKLGQLTHYFNIQHTDKHRALSDALATADLLRILIKNDQDGVIAKSLYGKVKVHYLPPHLRSAHIEDLPQGAGVYYFKDIHKRNIYIGKAKNLKKRIKSHFSNNSIARQKQNFIQDIYDIQYDLTGTELIAHILENTEIRYYFPKYNTSQKGYLAYYGLHIYQDRKGLQRIAIKKHNQATNQAILSFHRLYDANYYLKNLMVEFELCPSSIGLCKSGQCDTYEQSPCSKVCQTLNIAAHNKKLNDTIKHIEDNKPTFLLKDEGRYHDEYSYILIKKGAVQSVSFCPKEFENNLYQIEQHARPIHTNEYIEQMVLNYSTLHPEKVVYL